MSFINSVAKSMNGIKTIETSELIFTDDNSTLNTSAGITQAQSTGQSAINKSISAVGFNTGTGDLTLTTQGSGVANLSVDLDGRYLTSIGTLDANDIPSLPAGKITSDTFAVARIPALPYVSVGTAQAHDDETIFGIKTFDEFPVKSGTGTALNPSDNGQFATKYYVDTNGGGSTPSNMATTNTAQTISALKSFSNQRPKALSTAINTTATATEFITKSDGDGFYAPKNPQTMVKQEVNVYLYTVTAGNPADTNPNQYGGLIASRLSCYVSTFNGSYSAVSLDFSVVGEWANVEHDKGIAIARAVYVDAIPSGNYVYDKILRAPIQGSATSFIQNFTVSFGNSDRNSTMEACNGKYIDYDIEDDKLYSYTVLLVNSNTTNSATRFWLNRTLNGATSAPYERGTSCITAMLYN